MERVRGCQSSAAIPSASATASRAARGRVASASSPSFEQGDANSFRERGIRRELSARNRDATGGNGSAFGSPRGRQESRPPIHSVSMSAGNIASRCFSFHAARTASFASIRPKNQSFSSASVPVQEWNSASSRRHGHAPRPREHRLLEVHRRFEELAAPPQRQLPASCG